MFLKQKVKFWAFIGLIISVLIFFGAAEKMQDEATENPSTEVMIDDAITFKNDGYTSPKSYDGMKLVWSDEFKGTELDMNKWAFDEGDGCPNLCGWGNEELQYYTKDNHQLKKGYLIIEARNDSMGNNAYTSSRIKTQHKQSFKFGRIDIRAKLPQGQGHWPALWFLGSNVTEVGWPACGEIDIMELAGGTKGDSTVLGVLHWEKDSAHSYDRSDFTMIDDIFASEFHVFTLLWDENNMTWLVDDVVFKSVDISEEHYSEFRKEFFFIIDHAVGGRLPGSPDESTIFPMQFVVDYVRFFQKI